MTDFAPLDTFRRNSVAIAITGRVASDAPVRVVEYFNANFGHYFMSADPDEIANLDAGAFGGAFERTGRQFFARNGPVSGADLGQATGRAVGPGALPVEPRRLQPRPVERPARADRHRPRRRVRATVQGASGLVGGIAGGAVGCRYVAGGQPGVEGGAQV